MLESSPGQPYEGLSHFINEVEPNMKYRRKEVSELLLADEALMTISNFPRLGTPNFTWPIYKPQPKSGVSHSLYFPDEAISTNDSRYSVITRNIRKRRGKKVDTRVNIFIDEHTYIPVIGAPADNPDAVCMDATGFGTSCCSLQTTFQVHFRLFSDFQSSWTKIILLLFDRLLMKLKLVFFMINWPHCVQLCWR